MLIKDEQLQLRVMYMYDTVWKVKVIVFVDKPT